MPRSLGGRLIHATRGARHLPFKLLCGAALVGAVAYFGNYLASDYFALTEVVFDGGKRLSPDFMASYLEENAGVGEGSSALRINLGEVQRTLESIPEIATAEAFISWPNRIDIYVTERQAAAIFVSSTESFVTDASGFVFSQATIADFRNRELPALSGFAGTAIERGSQLPADGFSAAMNYERAFAVASPYLRGRLSELNWTEDRGIDVVLSGGERFECGRRSAAETGPVIEALLAKTAVDTATLYSPLYATVSTPPPGDDLAAASAH